MRRYLKVNEITRLNTFFQKSFISTHNRMMQIAVLYESVIYEVKLLYIMNQSVTKKKCSPRFYLANSGFPINPSRVTISVCSFIGTSFSLVFPPKILTIRCLRLEAGRLNNSVPFEKSEKLIFG